MELEYLLPPEIEVLLCMKILFNVILPLIGTTIVSVSLIPAFRLLFEIHKKLHTRLEITGIMSKTNGKEGV